MTKNTCLPKINVLLQFGGEILALLRSDDTKQLTLGTEEKLQGFVWSHQSIKVPIPHPQIAIRC